jgi:hypothetical protein
MTTLVRTRGTYLTAHHSERSAGRQGPRHDGDREQPGAPGPVGQDAERQGEDGAGQCHDGQQRPDLGIADVEGVLEVAGRRRGRRGVAPFSPSTAASTSTMRARASSGPPSALTAESRTATSAAGQLGRPAGMRGHDLPAG